MHWQDMINLEKQVSGGDANTSTLESLRRLAVTLSDLNEASNNKHKTDGQKSTGLPLSHWRELPIDVSAAYMMFDDGSELIRATSTKYTLVGKINAAEGAKLAGDLRKGCELISTGVLVLYSHPTGCGRSARYFARQSSRAVVATVISLIQSFVDGAAMEGNVGAQRTGAVWSACDSMKKVPKGNRSSMRRELLTWCGECNETMREFEEILDLGPAPKTVTVNGEDNIDCGARSDDFYDGMGTDDQYTDNEIPVAHACLALDKCSRGTIGAALKACECAGEVISALTSDRYERKKALLQWTSDLHELARVVGEGVTELGVLLYPPFVPEKLACQIDAQQQAVLVVHRHILDSAPATTEDTIPMPEEVTDLVTKLQGAIKTRTEEAVSALSTIAH